MLGSVGILYNSSSELIGNFDRTEPWSFECWFYQTSLKGCALASNMTADSARRGWMVTLYTGRNIGMVLSNTDGSNFLAVRTASSQYVLNAWNHVVYTYDGSSTPSGIKCYINGVSKTLSTLGNTLTGTIKSNNKLWLGHSNVYPYLNGRLDEVVIYKKVLTSAEVSQRYNSGNGTESLFSIGSAYVQFHLNETSGTVATDNVGGKNGVLINNPSWGVGKLNNCIYLNGTQFIEVA